MKAYIFLGEERWAMAVHLVGSGSEILVIYEALSEQFKANSIEMSETSAP